MATDKLIIRIQADTDKANAEIKKLKKQLEDLSKSTKKSSKETESALKKMTSGFSKVRGSINKVIAGFAGLGVVIKAIEFTKMAADAEQASEAFDTIFTDMGKNAEEEFNKIKEASKGLISESAIKQAAVTAVSLGVPLEKLAELMEVARVKARVMGTTVESAFTDLAVGIGRGSPMILDNLGLTIKLEDANAEYAKSLGKTTSQLTKQEKQIALTNAVISASADDLERFGDAELSAKEQTQAFNASLDDLKVAFGKILLEPMSDLAKATTEWINSLDKKKIGNFATDVSNLAKQLKEYYGVLKKIDDLSMPDLGNDSMGITDLSTSLGYISTALLLLGLDLTKTNRAVSSFKEQMESTGEALDSIKGFDGTKEQLDNLNKAVTGLIDEQEALVTFFTNEDPVKYAKVIADLEKNINDLKFELDELAIRKPFSKLKKDAKELSEATKEYSEKQLKDIQKFYKSRIKESLATRKKLVADEKKYAKEIEKINAQLASDLKKLDNDRFNTHRDVLSEIADIEREGMNEDVAYYDKQKDAAKALSDAKIALKKGEFEKYKYYIEEYKSLVTASAGQEIKVNERIAVTKEETSKKAIAGLKTYDTLMSKFYDTQEAKVKSAHDLSIKQTQIEMELTKKKLEGERAMLLAMQELIKQTTGKSINLDMSAINKGITDIATLQSDLLSLSVTTTPIVTDSTQIEESKQKIEELRTLTLNGVTLEVDADTKPADFDIDKFINKFDKDDNLLSMEVNPEYGKAQKEIESFRKGEEKEPIEVTLEPETKKLKIEVTEAKKPIETKVDFQPDTKEADRARTAQSKPVYVPVIYVPQNSPSGGGTPSTRGLPSADTRLYGTASNQSMRSSTPIVQFSSPSVIPQVNITLEVDGQKMAMMLENNTIKNLQNYLLRETGF